MHLPAFIIPAAAALFPLVSAHGYLKFLTIDGKSYEGPVPNNSPDLRSPIRAINDVSPVKGANTRALNCGQNALPAALVADAKPGSVVTFDWRSGESGIWPHNTGPVITYMAKCDNTTCDKFDPIDAKFFKIDEKGRRDDGKWAQSDLFEGKTVQVTLPTNLPAGDYMIRHEIIGLHIATGPGGAEFYPSCSQIRLSAPSSPASVPKDTVTFPGGYHDDDKGILVPNIFDSNLDYQFPGPSVLATSPANSTNPPPSTPSSTAPASAVAPSSTAGAGCNHPHDHYRVRSRFFRNI